MIDRGQNELDTSTRVQSSLMRIFKNHNQTPSLSLHTQRALKKVRITILPSPPPDSLVEMELDSADIAQYSQYPSLRRSQRVSETSGNIVLPTDSVEESDRFRSGSKWRQNDLGLLWVKFEPHEDSDLIVLDVDHDWTLSQHRSNLPSLIQDNTLTVRGRVRDIG